jgi:hypothetical protein
MASGHGVDKPNTAGHPGRQVHRERFASTGMDYAYNEGYYDDDEGLGREMERRAELEDEYGGGAGDWDH